MSPVCLGANLHSDLWVPNFGIPEYSSYTQAMLDVFRCDFPLRDGYLHPIDMPGHGIDLDEGLAARFPYQRAYLPVNRLEDGTLWHR